MQLSIIFIYQNANSRLLVGFITTLAMGRWHYFLSWSRTNSNYTVVDSSQDQSTPIPLLRLSCWDGHCGNSQTLEPGKTCDFFSPLAAGIWPSNVMEDSCGGGVIGQFQHDSSKSYVQSKGCLQQYAIALKFWEVTNDNVLCYLRSLLKALGNNSKGSVLCLAWGFC